MLLFGRDVIRRTLCTAQCVKPGSKGRKVILSFDRENKTEIPSICLPVSFIPTCVPKKYISHLYLTWVSPNYINTCTLKKILLSKQLQISLEKQISATNIFKTHKQVNAYPLCTTAYPAALNHGQSWTQFPFPQPPPYSTSNQHGQRPCRAGLEQESWVLPCSRHRPGWSLTSAETSQKPLVFQ